MPKRQSRIEKMIAELCPEGVDHISLGEITNEYKVRNIKRSISEVRSVTNSAGLVNTVDYFDNSRTSQDTSNYKVVRQGMFVYNPSRINVGSIAQHKEVIPVIVSPMYVVVEIDKFKIIPEYLELFLSSECGKLEILSKVEVGARFRLTYEAFSRIKLTLPPLNMQKEIVKILDTFTTLEAELEAELEARKKQYEYYREQLLMPIEDIVVSGKWLMNGKEVEWKTLGEVIKILRGKRLTKNQLSDDEKYPVYHGGLEPLGNYGQSNRIANTVMVINVGASAGTVGYSSVDFWSSDGCFCIGYSDLLISRYVYYALLCHENILRSKVRFAGIPTLDATAVESIKIPIPPLAEQARIVAILDKFDALVNDISVGLPAELNARRKQYEYYRNQLLTFKPLEQDYAR